MGNRIFRSAALACAAVLLVACEGEAPPAPKTTPAGVAPPAADPAVARGRGLDPAAAARGAELYGANCAVCHGAHAQGAPDWHKPGPDGKYPPPPLDGSAHAWHHPRAALRHTIKEGTTRLGGNMPAWKDKLSDAEIEAIIDWIVMRWPDEVYRAWLEIESRSAGR
jgi:mono/diheme cytochrome c family protein